MSITMQPSRAIIDTAPVHVLSPDPINLATARLPALPTAHAPAAVAAPAGTAEIAGLPSTERLLDFATAAGIAALVAAGVYYLFKRGLELAFGGK